MTYMSQMAEMRQRAADDGTGVDQIRNDYREALVRLQTIEGTTTSFASQQYVAEHQTWDLNWPEIPFPGIDPRDPSTLAAPSSSLNPQYLQSPYLPQQEQLRRQTSKKQRTPQPSSSQSFVTSSFPETSLGQRSLKKKTKVQHKTLHTKTTLPTDSNIIICDNCGEKGHGIRICTRNIDQYGFLNGCPRCNSRKHNYADCPVDNKKEEYRYMVRLRMGRPPLRWNKDYREIDLKKWNAETIRPQTAHFAAARKSQGISQGINELISDPIWLTPDIVGSQIHPLDLPHATQGFGADSMELDTQPNSTFPQTGPPQVQPQEQPLTTACKSADRMQISPSDIQGVQSLLAILKQLEARRMSNQEIEQNANVAPSPYNDSKIQILSNQNGTKKADLAPMIYHSSETQMFSSHGGAREAVAAPMKTKLDESADKINSKIRPNNLGNFYEITPPSGFLIANSANMASATYSQRQREEFNLPPSPVRGLFPTLRAQRPLGPMNIPQMLYSKSAIPSAALSGCVNCKRPGHELKDCTEPCGLCDRARHTAADCTFRL
ncbi:hypothetical protein DL95DRAFT_452848 [Leptodontidium sp. 2 PMI_412]|nr:hypothetical protein DL95DRAFT_452848 [Leptodontidium sp. 2 PMI_412]